MQHVATHALQLSEPVQGVAGGAARTGLGSGLVGRQVELPQCAQGVRPAGGRRGQGGPPAAPVDHHLAGDDLAAQGLDGGDHRQQRATESGADDGERVLTEGQAYEVTRILEGVITSGTGAGYTSIGCSSEAGKTGTSDDFNDA